MSCHPEMSLSCIVYWCKQNNMWLQLSQVYLKNPLNANNHNLFLCLAGLLWIFSNPKPIAEIAKGWRMCNLLFLP